MTELFRAHWPTVFGYLCRRTGDPVLAEELAQETFVKATAAFLGWRGGPAAAWLLAIARNVLTDHHRRGRKIVPLEEALLPAQAFPDAGVEVRAPIGDALERGRPAKDATKAFLATLPESVVASAVVEFGTPLSANDFLGLTPESFRAQVFLSPPYDEPIASWQVSDLNGFQQWVGHLSGGDDDALRELGAPPLKQLRSLAADPHVTGAVVERLTVAQLRALLADPRVASLNVAAVGFDPARQFPTS